MSGYQSPQVPDEARKWPNLYVAIARYRQAGASDLHVVTGRGVFQRLHGDLIQPDESIPVLGEVEVQAFLATVCTKYQLELFEKFWITDAGYGDSQLGRIRINAAQTATGIALAIRYLLDTPPPFADLDLPSIIAEWMHKPSGLVLFSGPTGSGKTTLQASLLAYALEAISPRVLTLEDPIEYLFADLRVSQHELGRQFRRFDQALSGFMRRDPDIIMMGEVRTRETAEQLLLSAESGHLVLGTVHASETSRVFDRILGMFDSRERDLVRIQLAQQLIGIVGMKLVKKAPKPGELAGRRAAVEIMVKNSAIASAVLDGKRARDVREAVTNSPDSGMMSLEAHLSHLVFRGKVELDEARSIAEHPDEVRPRQVAGIA